MTVREMGTVIVSVMMLFIIAGASADVHAAGPHLNKKSVTMDFGKTVTLKVKGTKQKAKWSSSDEAVVTVAKNGKQDWEEKSREYIEEGYIPVSMKMDFKEIYPPGIVPAEKQYWGPDEESESDGTRVLDESAIEYRSAA